MTNWLWMGAMVGQRVLARWLPWVLVEMTEVLPDPLKGILQPVNVATSEQPTAALPNHQLPERYPYNLGM